MRGGGGGGGVSGEGSWPNTGGPAELDEWRERLTSSRSLILPDPLQMTRWK